MRQELDDKLCANYPNLYKERNLGPQQTCMCWGFPGDGWYDLIDELSQVLEPLGIVAAQVKEKFGCLRFYTNGEKLEDIDVVDAAINKAMDQSLVTCELCGEPGKMRGVRWMMVRCDKCHEAGRRG